MCIRDRILRDSDLELPKHTFYVDNVFVYQPLPLCQRLYYMDIDLYRYFIGDVYKRQLYRLGQQTKKDMP